MQFLQREGASHQPYTPPPRRGQAQGGGGNGTLGGEEDSGGKRLSHQLDARLGEARRLQVIDRLESVIAKHLEGVFDHLKRCSAKHILFPSPCRCTKSALMRHVFFLFATNILAGNICAETTRPISSPPSGVCRLIRKIVLSLYLVCHVCRAPQETLEAEVKSLRGSLEEKDGLIDALREALRATATPGETDGGTAVAVGSDPTPTPVPEHASISRLVADGRAVPGRGVFAKSDATSRGRYHSRSSRLLGTPGPVAMAEAQAQASAATVAARHAGEPRRKTWNGSPPVFHTPQQEVEVGKADDAPAGDAVQDTRLLPSDAVVGDVAAATTAAAPAATAATANRVGEATVPSVPVSLVDMSLSDDEGASEASEGAPLVASSAVLEEAKEKEAHDGGDGGIVAMATAVTGTAWRVLWGSARVVGSRVGMDRGSEVTRPSPRRRDNSSHAVLII